MSNIVLILGQSGSGKSFGLKNLDPAITAVITPIKKAFPFRSQLKKRVTDNWKEIVESMTMAANNGFKMIVIEDFQYIMVNEFMNKIDEKGYTKFNNIAAHAWTIVNAATNLADDVTVYFICQSEINDHGKEKMKTIGKMLDNVIDLQGLFPTLVLAKNQDGYFHFRTKSLGDGVDSVKAPEGMIDKTDIPNDIALLDKYVSAFFNNEIEEEKAPEQEAEIEEEIEQESTVETKEKDILFN